jgi:hypothetical protein
MTKLGGRTWMAPERARSLNAGSSCMTTGYQPSLACSKTGARLTTEQGWTAAAVGDKAGVAPPIPAGCTGRASGPGAEQALPSGLRPVLNPVTCPGAALCPPKLAGASGQAPRILAPSPPTVAVPPSMALASICLRLDEARSTHVTTSTREAAGLTRPSITADNAGVQPSVTSALYRLTSWRSTPRRLNAHFAGLITVLW